LAPAEPLAPALPLSPSEQPLSKTADADNKKINPACFREGNDKRIMSPGRLSASLCSWGWLIKPIKII
jgi:hypothetical protein